MPKRDPLIVSILNIISPRMVTDEWWRWMPHNSISLFEFECAMREWVGTSFSQSPSSARIFKWAEWRRENGPKLHRQFVWYWICWEFETIERMCYVVGTRQLDTDFRRTVEMPLISIILRQCTPFSMIDEPRPCVRPQNGPVNWPIDVINHRTNLRLWVRVFVQRRTSQRWSEMNGDN